MKVAYGNYFIEIIDDKDYSIISTDNIRKYKFEYNSGDVISERFYPTSKHGIRITDKLTEDEISSAIICENGGATTVHEKSWHIENDKIWVCVCDKIYCLDIPTLKIEWHGRFDYATNFSINPYKGDFIIHGELDILRIDQNGKIKWRFGGRDIFMSENGSNNFIISTDAIVAIDWQGYEYRIDENGNELK